LWQKAVLTGSAVSHPIDLVNTPGAFTENVGNNIIIRWSPDSRYFYTIKAEIHGDNITVFRTDGAKFANGKCYLIGTSISSNPDHTDYGFDTPYSFDLMGDIKWLNNSQIQFITVPDLPPTIYGTANQKSKFILDLEKETLQSSPE